MYGHSLTLCTTWVAFSVTSFKTDGFELPNPTKKSSKRHSGCQKPELSSAIHNGSTSSGTSTERWRSVHWPAHNCKASKWGSYHGHSPWNVSKHGSLPQRPLVFGRGLLAVRSTVGIFLGTASREWGGSFQCPYLWLPEPTILVVWAFQISGLACSSWHNPKSERSPLHSEHGELPSQRLPWRRNAFNSNTENDTWRSKRRTAVLCAVGFEGILGASTGQFPGPTHWRWVGGSHLQDLRVSHSIRTTSGDRKNVYPQSPVHHRPAAYQQTLKNYLAKK